MLFFAASLVYAAIATFFCFWLKRTGDEDIPPSQRRVMESWTACALVGAAWPVLLVVALAVAVWDYFFSNP